MRRLLATVLTLSLLTGMLFAVVLALKLVAGFVSLPIALLAVLVLNVVTLLISPWVNDFVYRWLYDLERVTLAVLERRSQETVAVI